MKKENYLDYFIKRKNLSAFSSKISIEILHINFITLITYSHYIVDTISFFNKTTRKPKKVR